MDYMADGRQFDDFWCINLFLTFMFVKGLAWGRCSNKTVVRNMRTDEEPSGLVLINKKERINGWSCPLHPFQIIAWLFIVVLPVVYYGIIVAHLPKKWIPAGCIVSFNNTFTVFRKFWINSLYICCNIYGCN